jgi:HEAT repeat protein
MKYILTISAIVGLGAATAHPVDGVLRPQASASTAAADVADSLWREGRRAIADASWDRAATLFQRIRDRFPKSAYVADSYYWQAFALYQNGGNSALRQAAALLDEQRVRFLATAKTVKNGDSRQLATRVTGMRAQAGDAASAASIARAAEDAVRSPSGSTSASVSVSASAGGASRSRQGSQVSAGCRSEDEDDRVEALNALLQMRSEQALPLLKRVLARRDACSEVLRRKAVFLVSQKRGDEAADILIETAKNDPDRETREQAVNWLGQVNAEKAVTLLEQLLKTSTDEEMQDKALFALSQTRDPRGQQILRDYASREDAPGDPREKAIFWLGQRHAEDNALFLKQLFGKTKNEDIQQKILFSLSQTRGFGNDQWILDQAVNPKNSMEVRKQALFWGGQKGGVDVAKLAALYDRGGEMEFREQVIFVLSQRHRSPEALDKLIQIAKSEKNKDLRQKAIFWLGQSSDPRAIKALQEIIEK